MSNVNPQKNKSGNCLSCSYNADGSLYKKCRECYELTAPRKEYYVGQEVELKVKGVVRKTDTGHGACYMVELPQLDFINPRTIWINKEEING